MFDPVFKAVLAAIPSLTCLVHTMLAKLRPRSSGPEVSVPLSRGPAATLTPCTCTIEKESL